MFWMFRLGMRGASPGSNRVAHTPKPAGPVGLLGITGCIAVMVYGNVTHQWTVAWFIVLPLVCSAFIITGWITRYAGRQHAIDIALKNLPAPPRPPASGAELRERARQLSLASKTAQPPAPVTGALRNVKTYKQMTTERELTERMRRIAAILLTACPVCQSDGGNLCRFVPDAPVSLLDREQAIVVHDARIGTAIKAGTAKVTDVVAQFANQVPGTVWEAAL